MPCPLRRVVGIDGDWGRVCKRLEASVAGAGAVLEGPEAGVGAVLDEALDH